MHLINGDCSGVNAWDVKYPDNQETLHVKNKSKFKTRSLNQRLCFWRTAQALYKAHFYCFIMHHIVQMSLIKYHVVPYMIKSNSVYLHV